MAFRFRWGLLPPEYEIYLQRTFLPNPFTLTLKITITNNQDTTKYFKVKFEDPNLVNNPTTIEVGAIASGSTATIDASVDYNLPNTDSDFTTTITVEQYADSGYTTLEDSDSKTLTIHVYDILNRNDFVKLYKVFVREGYTYTRRFSGNITPTINTTTYASYPASLQIKYQTSNTTYSYYLQFDINQLEGLSTSVFINSSAKLKTQINSATANASVRYGDPVIGEIVLYSVSGNSETNFLQFYNSMLSNTTAYLKYTISGSATATPNLSYSEVDVDDIIVFLPKASITSKFMQQRITYYKDNTLSAGSYRFIFGDYHPDLQLAMILEDAGGGNGYWHLWDVYEDSNIVNSGAPVTGFSFGLPISAFIDVLGNRGWVQINNNNAYVYNYDANQWSTYSLNIPVDPIITFWKGEQDIVYALQSDGSVVKITVSSGNVQIIAQPSNELNIVTAEYSPSNDAVYVVTTTDIQKIDLATGTYTQIAPSYNLTFASVRYNAGGFLNNKVVFFGLNNRVGIIDTTNDTYTEQTESYPNLGTSPGGDPYSLRVVARLSNTPDFIYITFTGVAPNTTTLEYFHSKQYIYYIP